MKCFRAVIAAFAVSVFCSGCAQLTTKLPDPTANYKYPGAYGKPVVATFSGGGMRAAALSYGVLKELKKEELIDEVALVSSVSGGSVTAAYWALKGSNCFDQDDFFVEYFLKHNIQSSMTMWKLPTLLTWIPIVGPNFVGPFVGPFYNRMDPLYRRLNKLYGDATYEKLTTNGGATYEMLTTDECGKRPYLVINATDMATQYVFSFTQDQFDLICADLTKMRLAHAVAASAAYPIIAFSPVILENNSPCEAMKKKWKKEYLPKWIRDHLKKSYKNENRRDVLRARRGLEFLNVYKNEKGEWVKRTEDEKNNYIYLLDGGVTDNLGLSLPLTPLTTNGREVPSVIGLEVPSGIGPEVLSRIGSEVSPKTKTFNLKNIENFYNDSEEPECVFIVVNARSERDENYGKRRAPPGILSTVRSISGAILDSTSFLLLDKVESIVEPIGCKTKDQKDQKDQKGQRAGEEGKPAVIGLIEVTFDSISKTECRRKFQNISTSWNLSDKEINALIEMGGALMGAALYKRKKDRIEDICDGLSL